MARKPSISPKWVLFSSRDYDRGAQMILDSMKGSGMAKTKQRPQRATPAVTRHRDAVIKNRDALWRDALETAGLNFGCGTGQGDDLIRGAVSAVLSALNEAKRLRESAAANARRGDKWRDRFDEKCRELTETKATAFDALLRGLRPNVVKQLQVEVAMGNRAEEGCEARDG